MEHEKIITDKYLILFLFCIIVCYGDKKLNKMLAYQIMGVVNHGQVKDKKTQLCKFKNARCVLLSVYVKKDVNNILEVKGHCK